MKYTHFYHKKSYVLKARFLFCNHWLLTPGSTNEAFNQTILRKLSSDKGGGGILTIKRGGGIINEITFGWGWDKLLVLVQLRPSD